MLPETSVTNYQFALRNFAEERKSYLHGGGSLKSRILQRSHLTQPRGPVACSCEYCSEHFSPIKNEEFRDHPTNYYF